MVKAENAKKETESNTTVDRPKYKQMTVEILFTDGELKTVTFYKPADCFRYIERTVCEEYADSVRVELF